MSKLRAEALADSVAALQAHDVKAALAIRNGEYGQANGELDEATGRVMGLILRRTPQLLADCPREYLEPLQVAAAMMELWGTNTIREFVTIDGELNHRFDAQAIAFMLHSHACFLYSLEGFRDVGITKATLLGSGDPNDCEACRAADGATFTLDTVPELPLINCHCDTGYGCRLMAIAAA